MKIWSIPLSMYLPCLHPGVRHHGLFPDRPLCHLIAYIGDSNAQDWLWS